MADSGPVTTHVIIDTGNAQGKFIVVDATISEGHSFNADISEYPIEAGSDITDNVRIKPNTIKMDGVITDTPMDGLSIDGQMPQVEAYNNLLQCFYAKQPIIIQTSLDVFDSMIITSLDFPREAANGAALFFSMEAQHAEILENQRDTITVHLGGKGAPIIDTASLLCFSRPTTQRAQYVSYPLLLTDHASPQGTLTKESWDHFGYPLNIVSTVIFPFTGVQADGWIADIKGKKVYFPYVGSHQQALDDAAEAPLSDITGFTRDANGNWVDEHGRPLTASPSTVLGPHANQVINTPSAPPPTDAWNAVTQPSATQGTTLGKFLR